MNGYENYFPTLSSYEEGGYEARSSLFAAGVAERILGEALDMLRAVRAEQKEGKA